MVKGVSVEDLKRDEFLKELPDEALGRLWDAAETKSAKLGEMLIETDEECSLVCFLIKGRVRLVAKNERNEVVTLTNKKQGLLVPDLQAFQGEVSRWGVRSAGNSQYVGFPLDLFVEIYREYGDFASKLKTTSDALDRLRFCRGLPLFAALSAPPSETLISGMNEISCENGSCIYREGDAFSGLYIVRSGRVQIIKESIDHKLMGIAAPGSVFGSQSYVFSNCCSHTAQAQGEVVLYRLDSSGLDAVFDHSAFSSLLTDEAMHDLMREEAFVHEEEYANQQVEPDLIPKTLRIRQDGTNHRFQAFRCRKPEYAGIAIKATIASYFGESYDWLSAIEIQQRRDFGDNLTRLGARLDSQEVLARVLKLSADRLFELSTPVVVECREGRFKILLGVSRKEVHLLDPIEGETTEPLDSFLSSWTGNVITLSLNPNVADEQLSLKSWVSRFFPILRNYRNLLVWIGFTAVAVQVLGLAVPLFTQVIIDNVLVHHNTSLLLLMLSGILVITAFQLSSSTLNAYLSAHLLRRVGVDVVIRFFQHVLALPHRISSRWKSGDLLLRFSENERLLEFISQSGFKLIVSSISSLIYLGVLLSLNGPLTGIALVFVALYAAMLLIMTPRLRANDRRVFAEKSSLQSFLIELVTGIQTIKGLAKEGHFYKIGEQAMSRSMQAEFDGARMALNMGLISGLINQVSHLVVLGYGATLVLQGAISVGELVAFSGVLAMLLVPLQQLISIWDELQEIRIAFERISDVLQQPAEKDELDSELPTIGGAFRFEHVCFRYEETGKNIINDFSLDVLPGQKIAFVGRSGSGKTTLINLINKLLNPNEGQIFIDGMDYESLSGSALRRQIGVVEQSPYLFNGTIRENISRVVPDASLEQVVAAATVAGIADFIETLPMRYETQIGERGVSLSGGQRQRIIIARAVLNNPSILILDEATAALDTESERIIQSGLDELMRNRTVFVIAHRLSTIRNADLIVVLENGAIVETGKHEDLMEQGGLYYYLNTQSENQGA